MQNQFSAQLDAPECILGLAYFGSVTDAGPLDLRLAACWAPFS